MHQARLLVLLAVMVAAGSATAYVIDGLDGPPTAAELAWLLGRRGQSPLPRDEGY